MNFTVPFVPFFPLWRLKILNGRTTLMNETLTAKLLEETLTFLEKTFQSELINIDLALAWVIHLVIGMLFVVPALSVFLKWLRKTFGRSGRQEVLVCGHCREEVHEHCVRCPSCEAVFPSSFLRALLTVGVLFLASWTADLRESPLLFWSLIGVYGIGVLGVVLFIWVEKFREWSPARSIHGLVGRCVSATIKGRELWAKGELAARVLVVLLFYGSLLTGLHQYGLPSPGSDSGLAEVFTKLTFVCGLLAFTSLTVLIAQLRRFQGFATLVLALCSLLFFSLGAVTSHGLAGFMGVKQVASEEHWVMVASRQGNDKIELEYRNGSGLKIKSIVTVSDASQLRFGTSLLLIKRFNYRRYFLSTIHCDSIAGALPATPKERSTQASVWQTIWTPSLLIFHVYSLASERESPEWIKRIEARVDPQEPRTWKIPLAKGKAVEIYIDGVRIFYREQGQAELTELERF
jgi:hypothetical protein